MDEQLLHQTLTENGGVITLDEARAAGLSATMISDRVWARRWLRVAPRTYLVAGHRGSDEVRARAAESTTGEVLHGVSVDWWHGMLDELGPEVHVTVPRAGNPRPRTGVRVRRRNRSARDMVVLRDVWVTAPALSVLEAAVVVGRGSVLLDRMLQRGVRLDALLCAHQRNAGRTRARSAGRLLTAASDRAGSEAERVLLRIIRRAHIPGVHVGYPVHGYELNVAFPSARVAVEVDGWASHHDVQRFASDRVRQNVLTGLGWTVLRYTWHQLNGEPGRVRAEITAAVRRGLPNPSTPVGKHP